MADHYPFDNEGSEDERAEEEEEEKALAARDTGLPTPQVSFQPIMKGFFKVGLTE